MELASIVYVGDSVLGLARFPDPILLFLKRDIFLLSCHGEQMRTTTAFGFLSLFLVAAIVSSAPLYSTVQKWIPSLC